jgi:hypothetical protein
MKVLLGVVAGLVVNIVILSLANWLGTALFGADVAVNAAHVVFMIAANALAALAAGFATTGFGNATSRIPAVVLAAILMVLFVQAVLTGATSEGAMWQSVIMLLIAPPLIFAGAEIALRRHARQPHTAES